MAKSKPLKRDAKRQIISGLGKHFAKAKTIVLKGKDVKVADLIVALQTSINTGADTDAKRAVYLQAAKTSREADAAIDPTLVTFTEFLQSTMSATDLADFGLKPKTRATPDAATTVAANAKREATRKARGVIGKKARAKIVGVVPEAAAPAAGAQASDPAVASGSTKPGTSGSSGP